MTCDLGVTGFSRLLPLGLITKEQLDAALAHPMHCALDFAGPARQLVWMVEVRIASHGKLIAIANRTADEAEDATWDERVNILTEVLPLLDALVVRHNAGLLNELLADSLISKDEYDQTMGAPFPLAFESQAQALAHVVDSGVMSQVRFDAIFEQLQAERESPERAARLRLIEEASATVIALATLQQAQASTPRRSAWRKGIGVLLVCTLLAGGYQLVKWVGTVPGCGAGNTTDAVQTMFSPRIGSPLYGRGPSKVKLTDIREVGHVPVQRQRGCTANLILDGESLPYTYIVGPLEEHGGEIGVTGAQRAIVEARFKTVGENGDFANQAAPIGRVQLEAALRAGVNEMPGLHATVGGSPLTAINNIFDRVSEQRIREIADIEPVGACRAIQDGIRYACRVLIERNDPVFATIGFGSEILDAEFSFERRDPSAQWRMAEDFRDRFSQALVRTRAATLTGKKRG